MLLFDGVWFVFVFFFQAEDGIRDRNVTGVQTCALPICLHEPPGQRKRRTAAERGRHLGRERVAVLRCRPRAGDRSEERRVGKECRCRGWRDEEKKKRKRGVVGRETRVKKMYSVSRVGCR